MYTITSGGYLDYKHAIFIVDDETNEHRLVAVFEKEDTMDFFIGLLLNAPYSRRERLWEVTDA